jgi:hypothetical protein
MVPVPVAAGFPPGQGIAWLYPGDEGIENHPGVVFTENFESGDMDDLRARWGYMSNRDGKVMSFSDDVPEGSAGKRSSADDGNPRMKMQEGNFTRLLIPDGIQFTCRFYTKFARDHGAHTILWLFGALRIHCHTQPAVPGREQKTVSALP